MGKWKLWQIIFVAYLLLLNVVVFGVLGFVLLTNYILLPPQQFSSQSLAASTEPPFSTPTSVAAGVGADSSLPDITDQLPAGETTPAIVIPSVEIPPIPPPDQEAEERSTVTLEAVDSATVTPQPTIVAQVQAPETATSTYTPTPLPTSTPTSTYTPTPLPTSTPTATASPTASLTSTPTDTATPTATPRPTTTPTSTTTLTPLPTSTPTPTPSHTPQPTATSTNTPTRTPHPTATLTQTPRPSASPTSTASTTLRAASTLTSASIPATAEIKATAIAGNLSASAAGNYPLPTTTAADQGASDIADGAVDAISLTNNSIALSWLAAEKTAQYRIYSDMGSGYGVYIYKAVTQQPTFIDKLLRPLAIYSYRLTRMENDQEIILAQVKAGTFGIQVKGSGHLASQAEASPGAVTAAPTPLPPDAVLLGLVSDNDFVDDFNTLTIVGEVRNDSSLDVGQTDINVTLYDTAGDVVGTASGVAMLETIPPGKKSPFIITLSRPQGYATYSLRAVARPTPSKQQPQLSVIEVRRFEDDAGFFHIKGAVKNVGNRVARRVKVAASIYGRDNGVINVNFMYVNPPNLAPGEQAEYDVIFAYYPKYASQQVIAFEE